MFIFSDKGKGQKEKTVDISYAFGICCSKKEKRNMDCYVNIFSSNSAPVI